jgi:carbon monoxide dehydrogenase subunit G
MKMTGEEIIAAPRRVVWDALNDPEVLKQCITGCEEIKKKSDTEFEAKVTAKVGPVKASFIGAVKLSKLNPPRSYVISGEGKGGVAGFAKGGATVQLSDTADGQTKLAYDVDAQVGGKLAQIGSRLIDSTAKKMAADFFKKFNKVVSERAQVAESEKPSKPAAKKTSAKKAATKKAPTKSVAAADAKAAKAAAPVKADANAATEKPAKKSASKAASKAVSSKATAATGMKTAAKKPAKSAARGASKPAEAAAKAPAAAGTAASASQQATSPTASSASQSASKASDAMPPQAQAMSKLWLWAVIAAVAGLIVVWATGSGGGQ